VPAILWHIINNAAAILALYFGGESASIPIWLGVVLTVGFLGLVWEFLRYMKNTPPAATGPLAAAPSGSGSRVWRVAKVGGITALLALLTSTVCFRLASLGSDFLAPDYSRGDIVFYTRGPAFQPDRVTTGDVILYRRSGKMFFTRILAMDGEKVSVISPEDAAGKRTKMDMLRKDITGKVFWKFDPGAEVKGLLPKTKVNSKGAENAPHKASPVIQNESSQ
jgi:hypothetical protein